MADQVLDIGFCQNSGTSVVYRSNNCVFLNQLLLSFQHVIKTSCIVCLSLGIRNQCIVICIVVVSTVWSSICPQIKVCHSVIIVSTPCCYSKLIVVGIHQLSTSLYSLGIDYYVQTKCCNKLALDKCCNGFGYRVISYKKSNL